MEWDFLPESGFSTLWCLYRDWCSFFLGQQKRVIQGVVSEVTSKPNIPGFMNTITKEALSLHQNFRNFQHFWCLGKLQQLTLAICYVAKLLYILFLFLNSSLSFFPTFQKQEEKDSKFRSFYNLCTNCLPLSWTSWTKRW